MALEYACPKLRENKSVVKAAIRQNGMALQFASMMLRDDGDVALIAVRQNGMALKYVSERLTKDVDVVLAAVRRTGLALRYASSEMRNDGEVVTAAILRDSRAVKFLGSDYTSGKKKLVVSTKKKNMDDVDSLADEIAKRVMVDASRDWSEERSERQVNEREMLDKVLASRTPKSKGGFSFFEKLEGMKEYFFKPSLEKREQPPAVTTLAPVEVREETETIQEERHANSTQKFHFFENMGKYIDNSCQTGCGCIQSIPEPATCQTKLTCAPEKNDLVLEERTPAEIDLIMASQRGAREQGDAIDKVKEFNGAGSGSEKLGNGMIKATEVTVAKVSVDEVSETIIPDGMIIALKEKDKAVDEMIKATEDITVEEVSETNIEDGMIIALKEKETNGVSEKKQENTNLEEL